MSQRSIAVPFSLPCRSSGDSTVTIKTRAVFGAMLLLLVKLVIPVGIAFIALYLILFASVCRSASCDQVCIPWRTS